MEHVSTTKTCQNSECWPRDNVTVSKVYMHLYVVRSLSSIKYEQLIARAVCNSLHATSLKYNETYASTAVLEILPIMM